MNIWTRVTIGVLAKIVYIIKKLGIILRTDLNNGVYSQSHIPTDPKY